MRNFMLRRTSPTEADIMAGVRIVLARHPAVGRAWRNNVGSGYLVRAKPVPPGARWIEFGEPGQPDWMGYTKDGRILAIEVKRPGRRPSAAQAAWLDDIAEAGGRSVCVTSIDELWGVLDGYGR